MINLILFGPPGSGKGTQSEKLVEKYGFLHISTGELFRYHIAHETPLGKEIKQIVHNGGLVSDATAIAMIGETIAKNKAVETGFLLDGFPRTYKQAVALDSLLQTKSSIIHYAIVLDVSEDELHNRIAKRKKIENRTDDEDSKLTKRIEVFFNETIHALDFYRNQGKLVTIDARGDIDKVFGKICTIIDGSTV